MTGDQKPPPPIDRSGVTGGRPILRQESPRSVLDNHEWPGATGATGWVTVREASASNPHRADSLRQTLGEGSTFAATFPWLALLATSLLVAGALLFGMPGDYPPARRIDLSHRLSLPREGRAATPAVLPIRPNGEASQKP